MTALRQQPTQPHRLAWGVFLILLMATLLWDASGLDRASMQWFGNATGFPLRHHWLLERVLHDAMRHVATAVQLSLAVMVLWPLGRMRDLAAWERVSVCVGTTLALLAVNWIKRHSATSCPWDLGEYGGMAQYVSHWAWRLGDGGPGHCFPGGHASAALAFVAAPLPWLMSDKPEALAFGKKCLFVIAVMGLLLGLTQTVRGAHYPSHTLWTATVCWGVAALNHACFTRWAGWRARQRMPVTSPS